MTKYGNKPTNIDGISFDSKREARRWNELRMLERAGVISDLKRQIPFELVPSQRDPNTHKVVERSVIYKADFVYRDKLGTMVVEDAKGMRTPAYVIKRKLMLMIHGIKIKEV